MAHDREPVGQTCPSINAIESELEIIAGIKFTKLIDDLNGIRRDNELLREWGDDEARRVDQLEEELYTKNDYVRKMENIIEELRSNLRNAESTY